MKRLLLPALLILLGQQILAQPCTTGESQVVIQITPDNFPGEISWNLKNQNNQIIASGTYIGDTLCIPSSQCVHFTIFDSFGDGICCAYGNGSYSIFLDGALVTTGGNYTNQESTSFNCPPGGSCSDAISVTTGSYTAPGNDYWYSFVPSSSGMYTVSTCLPSNSCDTKIWIYDHCNNLVWDNTNVATIFYDDNSGNCGINAQLAQISAALLGGTTYILRIGSQNASCTSPIDFFIQYDGPITGCTDPTACNYNPMATVSDGSCLYWPDANCPGGPDLTVIQSVFESSLQLSTVNATNCQVQESCLRGYGNRTVIRFTTHIKNIGSTDYYIGSPTNNPTQFTYVNCHNHAHYEGYAEYVLYKNNGQSVPIGFKNGFCVMDLECSGGGTAQYGCSNQGITAGCGDIYSSGLECQWIDITDVPDGPYILAIKINWDQSPDVLGRYETDYLNNWAQVCINILTDAQGEKYFTVNSNCQPYVDCQGTAYGNAIVDCNGNCNGGTLMGDLNSDTQQNNPDAQAYISGILNGTLAPTTCNDLNNDNRITVWDAALLTNCSRNATSYNGYCTFPYGIVNTTQNTSLQIVNINTVNNTFDIAMHNPDARIKAMEFTIGGASIVSISPLYNTTSTPISPQYNVGGNKIVLMATNDSSFVKFSSPTAILRVSYLPGSTPICIEEIIHIVNSNYEATNTSNLSACATSVDAMIVADEEYLTVWPNPSNEVLSISLRNSTASQTVISFSNALGEVVKTVQLTAKDNQQVMVSDLPSGIYFLHYPANGKVWVKRIIIHH